MSEKKPIKNKSLFKKGVSGNPKGRPSNKKLAEKVADKMSAIMKKEFGEEINDEAECHTFLKESLAFFKARFETAKSPEEQERFRKLGDDISIRLMPYHEARRAALNVNDNKIDEIIIKFQDPEPIDKNHPMIQALLKELSKNEE